MSTLVPARSDAPQPAGPGLGLLPRLGAEAFGSLFISVVALGVPLFSIPQTSPLPATLAAGLAVTAAMLAVGHVSGGHFNPIITLGHLVAGRIRAGHAAAYVLAQLVGAVISAVALFGVLRTLPAIQDSRTAFDTVAAGFGEHSIVQAPVAAVILLELLGSLILVAVFLGATTRGNAARAAAPVAVGLAFAGLLQLGQTIGNLPYNPARALASAFFSSGWAIEQVWVFVLTPLTGAAIAGLLFRSFSAVPTAAVALISDLEDDAEADETDTDDDAEAPAVVPSPAETPADAVPAPATPATSPTVNAARNSNEAQEFFDGKRS
ncbi:Aquaporin Z [Arthrobacter ulcerisalmonis]|uniref:Aquaporin Z n=1 Tax=Arthrobacter ulcerisalmonis TaxID=2483813 RepID=A0A3P5WVK6_9MICC|nr:aquaporin [Arthrobacter ulcerisalmonis]VDC25815.1 Aquaporin Z [Arthrobacter ulcerisalmonis]